MGGGKDDDDDDCYNPVCGKSDPQQKYRKYISQWDNYEEIDEQSNNKSSNQNSQQYQSNKQFLKQPIETNQDNKMNNNPYQDCPNNRESLGFFTWNFLHTMSVYYPSKPKQEEKIMMQQFIEAFVHFYPCKICSKDLKREINKQISEPPNYEDREQFSIWLCKLHNDVNLKLGKPIFNCEYDNILKRWRDGYEHCKENKSI